MSILGSLVISLEAQTASFISGMSGAAKTARTTGREIEGAFSNLSSVAETALAPFGELGAVISETLGKVGESANTAIQLFSKMGGILGGTAAVAGGAAAALLAVEAGAIGLAIHAAEGAAKLGELSEKTGVSTQSLAALGVAGKSVGVDIDTLAKALELMNASAVKAAIAPNGAKTAYSRLGIQVRETSGQIKDTSTLFSEVATKLASLPQPEEGYFAKQIFGKGGTAAIPIIELGAKRLAEIAEESKASGLGDPAAVAASQKFKEVMEDISVLTEGVALGLAKDLLPSLTFVAEQVTDAFKTGSAQAFIDKIAELVKGTIVLGGAFVFAFEEFSAGGQLIDSVCGQIIGALKLVDEASTKPWVMFEDSFKQRVANLDFKAPFTKFKSESDKAVADMDSFTYGVLFSQAKPPSAKPKTGTADTATADPALEGIRQRIAALQLEAVGWLQISSAGTRAEQLIAEAVKKGNDEFNKLKESAAKDKVNPVGALALVTQNESLIKGAEAAGVYGAAVRSLTSELGKQGDKFRESDVAARTLAAAYQQGGSAIATAVIAAKFPEQVASIDSLTEAYRRLSVEPLKNAGALQILATGLSVANKALDESKAKASALASDELSVELNKQSRSYSDLAKWVDNLSSSYLKGADAVRAARVELDLYKYVEDELLNKGVTLTPVQIQQKRTQLTTEDTQSYDATIKQQAAEYDLNVLYDDQITKLLRMRQVLDDNGTDTLLVDAKLFDAQNSLIHQWDEAAIQVGDFGQKYQAVMNELVLQGRQAGAEIAKAFLTAVDSTENALAKLMTGKKANFKQIAKSLEQSVIKSELQKAVGGIAAEFGVKMPSAGRKPDGSASDPLYVAFAHGIPSIAGAGGDKSGVPGILNSWGINNRTDSTNSAVPETNGGGGWSDLNEVAGTQGGVFSKIFRSMFGGVGIQPHPAVASGIAGSVQDGTQSNPYYVLDATTGLSVGMPYEAGGAPTAIPGVVGATSSNSTADLTSALNSIFPPSVPAGTASASTGPFTPGGPVTTSTGNGLGSDLNMALRSFTGGGGGSGGGHGGGAPRSLTGVLTNLFGGMANKYLTGKLSALMTSQAISRAATASQTTLGSGPGAAGGGEGGGIGIDTGALTDAATTDAGASAAAMSANVGDGIGADLSSSLPDALPDTVSDFSDIFPDFGGGMALGGDVKPGHHYIVGEKHPEWFTPTMTGRISPTQPGSAPAQVRTTTITNNWNVPAPADLWKKSNNQITADQARQMSMLNSRR